MDGVGGAAEPRRGGGGRVGRAPVGEDDRHRAGAGGAGAIAADEVGRGVESRRERRAPARAQRGHGRRGVFERGARGMHDVRPRVGERDDRDAVAARVGLAQQPEQRPLHPRHPPARAHRAARVDDEAQQHARAAGADVHAVRAAVAGRQALAQGRDEREIARGRRRRAAVDRRHDRVARGGAARGSRERQGRRVGRSRVEPVARRRCREVAAALRGGAAVARAVAEWGPGGGAPWPGGGGSSSGGGASGAALLQRAIDVARIRRGAARERVAPAAVHEREVRRAAHVLGVDLADAVERREHAGGARGHDVAAHPVDADLGARAHDPVKLARGQPHGRQPLARGDDRRRHVGIGGGEARAERDGIGLERQPAAHDLGARGGLGRCADLDAEPEAVEQLRAQLALLGVHRPDEQEARVVAHGHRVALDVADAHRGCVEQDVDEVVGQQVDLVDVEHAAVRAGEQAGLERALAGQRAAEIQRAGEAVDRRADRQLDQRRRALFDRRAGVDRAVRGEVARREAERLAGGRGHRRQQRRERAHRRRLRRPALAAHEHAADLGRDRVDEQRLAQRLLADDRRERIAGHAHADASSSSPSSSR